MPPLRLPKRALALAVALAATIATPAATAQTAQPSAAPCFGAAALDLQHPCASTARTSVYPSPAAAVTLPNSPCRAVSKQTAPPVCSFGVPAADGVPTIAIVGDSHAGHWRAAVDYVAHARQWHGLSITHTSCPLQKALRDLPGERRALCARWKHEVFSWFSDHPEVNTVFVAGLTGGSGVVPSGGHSAFETSVAGYRAAWDALPASVQHIVVIRDTPKGSGDTNACVARAVAHGREPGAACAVPRKRALDPDPAIAAASRMASPRVQSVDLTRFFCTPRVCEPVVGGALVRRDNTHLTGIFSATLGPYLLDAVTRLGSLPA
jgi:hypothetical protein